MWWPCIHVSDESALFSARRKMIGRSASRITRPTSPAALDLLDRAPAFTTRSTRSRRRALERCERRGHVWHIAQALGQGHRVLQRHRRALPRGRTSRVGRVADDDHVVPGARAPTPGACRRSPIPVNGPGSAAIRSRIGPRVVAQQLQQPPPPVGVGHRFQTGLPRARGDAAGWRTSPRCRPAPAVHTEEAAGTEHHLELVGRGVQREVRDESADVEHRHVAHPAPPSGSMISRMKSPMRKVTSCPSCWNWRILFKSTVCPRCRSGAVGSKPAFTCSGVPRLSFLARSAAR